MLRYIVSLASPHRHVLRVETNALQKLTSGTYNAITAEMMYDGKEVGLGRGYCGNPECQRCRSVQGDLWIFYSLARHCRHPCSTQPPFGKSQCGYISMGRTMVALHHGTRYMHCLLLCKAPPRCTAARHYADTRPAVHGGTTSSRQSICKPIGTRRRRLRFPHSSSSESAPNTAGITRFSGCRLCSKALRYRRWMTYSLQWCLHRVTIPPRN